MITREMASALADDAQRQGKPLFYLANDIVKVYLRAREKGYDLDEMVDAYEALMFARRMGHVLIPDELFDNLVGKTPPKSDKYMPASKESGIKMGKYAESIYPNPIDGLKHLLPYLFWDLTFDIRSDGNSGTLCVTCPRQAQKRGQLVAAFIEGFLEACNFSLQKSEVIQGLIRMDFARNQL